MSKWTEKIPSFVWVLIIVGAVAAFIGALWGGFYAISYIEGFGSVIMLAAGWACLRLGANSPDLESSSLALAFLIFFFAMMGLALDHPGNALYNEPMQWIFCPADTELMRETTSRAARGGGVALSQRFTCVTPDGRVAHELGWEYALYRFFQYVALGYLLLGLSRFYSWLKGLRREQPPGNIEIQE